MTLLNVFCPFAVAGLSRMTAVTDDLILCVMENRVLRLAAAAPFPSGTVSYAKEMLLLI